MVTQRQRLVPGLLLNNKLRFRGGASQANHCLTVTAQQSNNSLGGFGGTAFGTVDLNLDHVHLSQVALSEITFSEQGILAI